MHIAHAQLPMHPHTHACTHTHTQVNSSTVMHILYTQPSIYIHGHTHTYINVYMHAHTHSGVLLYPLMHVLHTPQHGGCVFIYLWG